MSLFGNPPPHLASGYFLSGFGLSQQLDGTVNNVGSNGYFWSAVPNSTNNGRNLNFNSSNINPLNNNNRSNGFAVRPVQEFTAA